MKKLFNQESLAELMKYKTINFNIQFNFKI